MVTPTPNPATEPSGEPRSPRPGRAARGATRRDGPGRDGPGRDRVRVVAATPRPRRAGTLISRAIITGFDLVALAAAVAVVAPTAAGGALGLAILACLAAGGTHRSRLNLAALDDAARIALLGAAAIAVTVPFADDGTRIGQAGIVAIAAVVFGRCLSYGLVRRRRTHGRREPTIIAGSGHVGIELAHLIALHPEYGLDVVGFVGAPFPGLPAPLLGEVAHLDELVTELDVRRVIVAFGPTREVDLVGVLRTAVLRSVQVYVVPRFFDIGVAPRSVDTDDLWGIPLVRVRQSAFTSWSWKVKRAIDIAAAGTLLVITAPVMAAAAAAVRLSSPGPILFRQPRVGQGGREFEVLKFRTLPKDHVDDSWNAADEQYRNRVGMFLRRGSIDELPQLWNVLRGDMSLVGPRPERGYLVEEFNSSVYGYRDRHRLPMGLTGWAQVHGLRGETSLRERVRFDNQYIEQWSLWRDLTILVRTVGAVFRSPHRSSVSDDVTGRQFGVAATVSDHAEPDADAVGDTSA